MARSNDPLAGLGGRIARNVTSRLVSKVVGLILAAVCAGVGLNQCGKKQSVSREQSAQHSTAIINVNTASLEELMTLPRVNDNLGRRIIAGRPYGKVDDLEKVSGIGPKTLEGMRARVAVGQSPATAPAK
jgi:DNA uptake protein ComE-like DNA-binding protein